MLRLQRVEPAPAVHADRATYPDRLLFHTPEWLAFVAECQGAEPVLATVSDGGVTVGHFTGLLVRRYGLRILGSPMAGWTTSYLGFNLKPGVSRRDALGALTRFAFDDLGCAHLEVRDRGATEADLAGTSLRWDAAPTAVIDLRPGEDALFGAMASACRRNIRKAAKSGVTVEEADADPAFADEFYDQLRDVFAKQNLVPTYSVERVKSLIRHLAPAGRISLLRARDPAGRCVATAVLPWAHRTMYFWGGASYREHQHLRPNEALIWYALRWAKARGVTEFDFVGGNPYKAKYGTTEVAVPWARQSRSPLVATLRDTAKQAYAWKQRTAARLTHLPR
ncbi:amino acid racemase [Actinoplanes sp. SE50]|uniref:lipid II:glycine glycyltransferase FemX n=1 Tax=unclassified Actinoplanes TaxID=2626549 RepID=UPI00023EC9FE|nr:MULTISPECIES: GNAT family N-acetyltransferase [unclassified Actinoplanes]AEV86522.1 Aminoacyltransferase femX [Actinoplanes sp. SE50/110]ATO84920.1 amino acid racemase [Actinoplanes sp. SE50]SLM02329.1 amino-acid racemase [Actinoplanes sp. SE50/110]